MKLHPDHKIAGVLAPVFALRGEGDLGIGDVAALREFVSWAAAHGFGLVQILPINETGPDNSPYNAVSSTALDPVLLRTHPDAIKELSEEEFAAICARHDAPALRDGPVRYPEVKALKRALLEAAFAAFEPKLKRGTSRALKFRAFAKQHRRWLDDYTLFRVLMDLHRTEQWDLWPEECRTATQAAAWLKAQPAARRRELDRGRRFHAYVQWVAFSQWAELKEFCARKKVALMGDIPIGVSYYSSDVFSRPDIFDLGWSGGAPPERVFKSDPFTEKWGQNWGVPLYRWDVLKARDYDWWRQRVRTIREVFHLIRIDHVLGFYRIYSFPWRPQQNDEFLPLGPEEAKARTGGRLPHFQPHDDTTPENREANRLGGEELLRMVLEEVGEYRLIGEDLGVVPDYVRPSLASLGIAGFKIPMWETGWDGRFIPGGAYNRLSLATYATHDHDPMRTMWEKWTATLRAADGGDGAAAHEAPAIRDTMGKLLAYAGLDLSPGPLPYDDALREGLFAALLRCNSWVVVAMITDVFGTTERFNVPGAVANTNWTCRLPLPVAKWKRDKRIAEVSGRMADLIAATGRKP